ncbi:MAG: hypothetical protein HFG37_11660 [Eubacterium sp.]|nr:hypothetical protein [Eubacterium sp.]
MDILMESSKLNNNIIEQVRKYITPFDSFKHVFLFGSALELNTINNDIDILIIYTEYSNKFDNDLILFSNELEKEIGMLVDITSLSVKEEKEIQFLDRIKSHCLKLK